MDLLTEAGAGAALTAVPILGGILAAGLDATIAATLTWRVGTMVSAYYQHGGCWINNRQSTYKMASSVVGTMSPKTEDRADLNHMAQTNRSISEKQIAFVMNLIQMFRTVATNKDQIRVALKSKQIPSWIVEEGLRRAFA